MSLLDRLKHSAKMTSVLSGIALGSVLMTANTASNSDGENDHHALPKSRVMMMQKERAQDLIRNSFSISGSVDEKKSIQNALEQMYGTPEGQILIDSLNKSGERVSMSLSEMGAFDYGETNPKQQGFPVVLNKKLSSDSNKLITVLFHELCHVRQYRDGVGRINDTPEEKYDLTLANEIEARLTTALMASHLKGYSLKVLNGPITAENWMESDLDIEVYQALSNKVRENLSEKETDKFVKNEMLKSALSGQNTQLIEQVMSSTKSKQYEDLNKGWLSTYSMNAGAHAVDDFYPTITKDSQGSSQLMDTIAKRMNVDKKDLLSLTGIDLVNVEQDKNGNIISYGRKQRATGENLGSVNYTYDKDGRPLSGVEIGVNQSILKKTQYEYENTYLPMKKIETTADCLNTVYFDVNGKRTKDTVKRKNSETVILYQNGHKIHETLTHEFGVADTEFDINGNRINYVHKTNDGVVIDEYHAPKNELNGKNGSILKYASDSKYDR